LHDAIYKGTNGRIGHRFMPGTPPNLLMHTIGAKTGQTRTTSVAYNESGPLLTVEHDGEAGEFILAMYVDNALALASGREISAYPKKLGKPRLYVDFDTLVGTLDYRSLRVATATMGYKHQPLDIEHARAEIVAPSFMLKVLRGYDGRPRICELVRTQIIDIAIKGAWASPAGRPARAGNRCCQPYFG
jgi:acetoacetate decarboxylase